MRVLLVDAGGVLFNNVSEQTTFLRELADRYGASPARLGEHLARHDAEFETDTRHVHDVLADGVLAAGAPPGVPLDTQWVDQLYLNHVRAHPTVFAALRRLRQARPDLVLALANNEAAHWDRLKDQRFGHLRLFDVIGSSWRLRAVKPGPEYLTRLLEACRCDPGDALLVDDNRENTECAAAYGLRVAHVTRPPAAALLLDAAAGG